MISEKLKKSIISITNDLKDVPNARCRHFSFIICDGDIVSLGYNNSWQQHPLSIRLGYRFGCIHSEIACLLKYDGKKSKFKDCVIANTRINRFGKIGMAKPCSICESLIKRLGFKHVFYTDYSGVWKDYKVN